PVTGSGISEICGSSIVLAVSEDGSGVVKAPEGMVAISEAVVVAATAGGKGSVPVDAALSCLTPGRTSMRARPLLQVNFPPPPGMRPGSRRYSCLHLGQVILIGSFFSST